MPESLDHITTDYRTITFDDIPWVLSLAYERYRPFDPGTTLTWLVQILRRPEALAIRSDNAFLIANIVTGVWQPKERDCHVIFCCAADKHHWEAVRLVKQSVTWARGCGCRKWWFSSETDFDVEPLALRAGAKPDVMRYSIDLFADRGPLTADRQRASDGRDLARSALASPPARSKAEPDGQCC